MATNARDASADYQPTHPLGAAAAEIAGDEPTDRPRRRAGRTTPVRPARRSQPPRRLTVVYDETCELCRRPREWLATHPTYAARGPLAAGSDEAQARYGALPWLGQDPGVGDDHGRVWVGPAPFLLSLWPTR